MQISIGSRLRKQRSRVERRTRRLIMEAYVGEEVVDGVDRGRRGGGGGGWSGEGCERALVGGGGRRIGVMEAGGVGVEGIRVREYIRRGIWSRAEAGIVGIIRGAISKEQESSSMTTIKILGAVAGSIVFAYVCDTLISEKKIFGGTTPKTVADKEWWEATDKKFQAWPRTAGPPVVMNPISRQNFIVKSPDS